VIDEKNLLNETNQDIKKELQSLILDLEEKLKEQQKIEGSLRSEIETLKIEIAEKSVLQRQLEEIEGQLTKSASRLNEEVVLRVPIFFVNECKIQKHSTYQN